MSGEKHGAYRAYVLRCWQEQGGGAAGDSVWRFSVEEIPSIHPSSRAVGRGRGTLRRRRRRGFGSLEGLIAFLRHQLDQPEDRSRDHRDEVSETN